MHHSMVESYLDRIPDQRADFANFKWLVRQRHRRYHRLKNAAASLAPRYRKRMLKSIADERRRGCDELEHIVMPFVIRLPDCQPNIGYAAAVAGAFVAVRDGLDALTAAVRFGDNSTLVRH